MIMNQKENTARASDSRGSDDLQSLKRGEISMDQYIERRLELQVQNLGRYLTDKQRAELREILVDHFLDDPVLRHYAELASGKTS